MMGRWWGNVGGWPGAEWGNLLWFGYCVLCTVLYCFAPYQLNPFFWQFGQVHCLHDSLVTEDNIANRDSQNLTPHLHVAVLEGCILVNSYSSHVCYDSFVLYLKILLLIFIHFVSFIFLNSSLFKCTWSHNSPSGICSLRESSSWTV